MSWEKPREEKVVLEAQTNKKLVTIFGASDDLIEASGIPGADEFGAYIRMNNVCNGIIHIINEEPLEQMFVHCYYSTRGCWHFAPAIVNEGKPLPLWRMEFSYDPNIANVYSTIMTIEVPENAYMNFHKKI